MSKEELILNIREAFKDVELEDGIGLWESQGIDDLADKKSILELRKKDEKIDWNIITYNDISLCQSSLSFFDSKGMRFCLPKFLMFDVLQEQIYQEQGIEVPNVLFALGYNVDGEYSKNKFSMFNDEQIQCVVNYLKYKLDEIAKSFEEYAINYGSTIDSYYSDDNYIEIKRILNAWEEKTQH